ncbi:MAG: VCBS repeat-containing protein [Planctomycetes bacterium]|nr:VCBS repeat-containing protein [Planctomycetota bacterium]
MLLALGVAAPADALYQPWTEQAVLGAASSGGTPAAGDFDGDGDLDVVHLRDSSTLEWFENLGNRSFGPARALPSGGATINKVVAGDWDGDGFDDVFATETTTRRLRLWLSDGQGGFAAPTTLVDFDSVGPILGLGDLHAADIENDGTVEVFAGFTTIQPGNTYEAEFHIYRFGQPVFASGLGPGPASPTLATGDLTGDGLLDLVWVTNGNAAYQRTGGMTGPAELIGAVSGATPVVFDLDGDGDLDVAAGTIVYRNNGNGPSFSALTMATSGTGGFDYDLDGDGDLVSNTLFRENWHVDGTSWGTSSSYTTGGVSFRLLGDFDGDGAIDVLGISGSFPDLQTTIAFNPATTRLIMAPPPGNAGRNELIALSGSIEDFLFSSTTVAQANEVAAPVGANAQLGPTLTFPNTSTGLCHSFRIRAFEAGANLVFDDQEGSSAWDDAISIGDIDNHENDNFYVDFIGPLPVYSFGLYILDNGDSTNESMSGTAADDGAVVVWAAPNSIPPSGNDTRMYIGFHSSEPISGISFNEDNGGDDIGIEHLSFGTGTDSDGDTLSDCDEQTLGTDWNLPDTDGDGLLDPFEVAWGFDPLLGGEEALDGDIDGLTNLEEQALGTTPTVADTDGDGFDDGLEVASGTDPLDDQSFPSPPAVPALPLAGWWMVAAAIAGLARRQMAMR